MTTINDISDLIRILRDDPAWAEAVRSVLLSQELLRLPEEVAALTRAFREHAETTNRRLESLEKGQDELRQGQAQLQTTVDRLESTVNGMRGDIGNMSGSFFQRRTASFAERVARRDFNLHQTSLAHHVDRLEESAFIRMLQEAAEDPSRDFTADDAYTIEEVDAIIMGRDPDGTEAYLVVEMSVTVTEHDVDRAKDGADLLHRATRATTHALVIGRSITDKAAALARHRGVSFAEFIPKRPARP